MQVKFGRVIGTAVLGLFAPASLLGQSISPPPSVAAPRTVASSATLGNNNCGCSSSKVVLAPPLVVEVERAPHRPLHVVNAAFVISNQEKKKESFHWGRALRETGTFLAIQHLSLALGPDKHWVLAENGVPFNHYWRDYTKSLGEWVNSGWDDGDSFRDNYVAHPLQGAFIGFLQIQNDPASRELEFENSRRYWWSKAKAMGWATAHSIEFEIGPISEMTVEKYGTWGAWRQNGRIVNGLGQVDMVMTPTGGMAWMLTEDLLDRYVVRGIEGRTQNRFLIAITRALLNPARSGANIMHGKAPWHRSSRTAAQVYFQKHSAAPAMHP